MNVYNCEICNYRTNRHSDLIRHNQSKKHCQIISQQLIEIQTQFLSSGKDPKKTQKDPVFLGQKTSIKSSDSSCCMYWNKSFKYTTNLYKHQNYRCKIEKSQELEQTEISEFEQQVIEINWYSEYLNEKNWKL